MTPLRFAAAVAALCLSALPGLAHDGIHINDPYARIIAGSGVVYFQIENMQTEEDTLIGVHSDIGMAMLMNSTADANGVMQMQMLPDGITVPAGQVHLLKPAADHVMLTGVTTKPKNGDTITLTLTFAGVGDVVVTVPVDNARRTDPGSAGATPFDVMSAAWGHHDHTAKGHDMAAMTHEAEVPKGAMSMAATPDQEAIIAVLKAEFDKPEAPLSVDPVVVVGDSAVATWAQGDMAGRALLTRHHGGWQVVLCGGPELRDPAFLTANGVSDAAMLSQMFNSAEDGVGGDLVTRASGFQGVVMMSGHGHN